MLKLDLFLLKKHFKPTVLTVKIISKKMQEGNVGLLFVYKHFYMTKHKSKSGQLGQTCVVELIQYYTGI